MKYKIVVLVVLFIGFAIASAAIKPPKAIMKAFTEKFPNATNSKWEKESTHDYEVEFNLDGAKQSANFSENGDWLESESKVEFNALPEKVRFAFSDSHKNATIKVVEKIESSKGTTTYEIEIKDGKKLIEIIYSSDGVELKIKK